MSKEKFDKYYYPPSNSESQTINYKIEKYDAPQKSLTSRSLDQIQQETGVPPEEMFPKDKKILYVGDPWQKMGREINDPKLTIIDYEYGETASFVNDEKKFRKYIDDNIDQLLKKILIQEELKKPEDKQWLNELYQIIAQAYLLSTQAGYITKNSRNVMQEYQDASDKWQEAKKIINKKTKLEFGNFKNKKYSEFEKLKISLWHFCNTAGNGFKDILDWHNTILPQLQNEIKKNEKLNRKKLDEKETETFIEKHKKRYIEEIRLQKRTKKSNVVEAMFPALPFKDGTFDRFVASWSISAHIFNKLNQDEFQYCWEEIIRVLNNEGEAYIFPIGDYIKNKNYMIEPLKYIAQEGLIEYKILDKKGEEIKEDCDIDCAYTLWIGKKIKKF
ncbi:MAG: hypothetical protein V1688_00465 [bacterium]